MTSVTPCSFAYNYITPNKDTYAIYCNIMSSRICLYIYTHIYIYTCTLYLGYISSRSHFTTEWSLIFNIPIWDISCTVRSLNSSVVDLLARCHHRQARSGIGLRSLTAYTSENWAEGFPKMGFVRCFFSVRTDVFFASIFWFSGLLQQIFWSYLNMVEAPLIKIFWIMKEVVHSQKSNQVVDDGLICSGCDYWIKHVISRRKRNANINNSYLTSIDRRINSQSNEHSQMTQMCVDSIPLLVTGWWWLEPWNFMTFHILGINRSQLTNSYFSEG